MSEVPDVLPAADKLEVLKNPSANSWDPFNVRGMPHSLSHLSATASVRIKRDISQMFSDPIPGIIIYPDEKDLTFVYALITGLFDTPYEGGLFLFAIRFPCDYPIQPPRVRLLTTDSGKVRFNPNWYKDGKVCVSILNTWSGPGWTPGQTLSSVLISIQSLMNARPYHNEPGFDKERHPGDSDLFNKCIEHETIRVAVCDALQNDTIPTPLRDLSTALFLQYYEHYVDLCKEKMSMDGQDMKDPFGWNKGKFIYGKLLERLQKLHDGIVADKSSSNSSMSSDVSSSKEEG